MNQPEYPDHEAAAAALKAHAPRKPGMDGSTGRCFTCDSRRCGTTCDAQEGYVWVEGVGWRSPEAATTWEMEGRTVRWDDVWHD